MADQPARDALHGRQRQEAAIDRYWDAIADERLATAGADLDPRLARTIRRVHALAGQPVPEPDFAQSLWRDLMNTHGASASSAIPLPFGNGLAKPEGFAPAPRLPLPPATALPARGGRRQAVVGYLGAAALIAAVLALALFVFGLGEQHQATPPAVPASPSAVPAPVATTETDAWVGFGSNAARTRVAAGSGPAGAPVVLWTYPPAGVENVHAEVDRGAAAGGVLYLPATAGGGAVVAIDARTGAELWRADGYGNAVLIDGDGLLVQGNIAGGDITNLARISRADGSLVWQSDELTIAATWNPVVADGVGYVPTTAGDVAAFDPATGAVLWRLPLTAPPSRGGSIADGILVLGDEQGTVYGISVRSRDVVWTFESDAPVVSHPVIANGAAFVLLAGGAQDSYAALDLATGSELWRFTSPTGAGFKNGVVDGTTVYLPAVDGILYALDAKTGSLRYQFNSGAPEIPSGVLAGDTLYFPTAAGQVIALDPAAGTERWRQALDSGSLNAPIVLDHVLYESTELGTLYAIGGADSAAADGMAPAAAASPTAAPPASTAAASAEPPDAEFLWASAGDANNRLDNPLSIAISPDGDLWVCDRSNRFFIFDLDGNLNEIWGESGTGPGQFRFTDPNYEACGIAFAADGTFYVADWANHRIQHFAADRSVIGEWGNEGRGDGQFIYAFGIALGVEGNVVVADYGRNDLQAFTPNGAFLATFDGTGGPTGPFVGVGAIAIAPNGDLYALETDANRVRIFGNHGSEETTVIGAPAPGFDGFNYPVWVALDEAGNLYVVDSYHNRIAVFDPAGQFIFAWGTGGTADGQFNNPGAIALNRGGAAYVVDWHGDRVEKFKITGALVPPTPAGTPVS